MVSLDETQTLHVVFKKTGVDRRLLSKILVEIENRMFPERVECLMVHEPKVGKLFELLEVVLSQSKSRYRILPETSYSGHHYMACKKIALRHAVVERFQFFSR